MNEFYNVADEDLIEMYKRGVKTVDNILIKRYAKLIHNKSRGYFMNGLESDDLYQEGMIGFYKAIITYKGYENVPFCVFAASCINRQLITVIKKAQAGKHSPLNNSISIDASIQSDNDSIRIIDILAIPKEYEPENYIVNNESVKLLIKTAKENLSELEFKILKGYLQSKSYAEIADEINASTKTVDNALQRIKRKLIQSFESLDYSFN